MSQTNLNQLIHDLRNPLNTISMQAELAKLLLNRQQPDKVALALDTILQQCQSCSDTLHALRDKDE